MTASRRTRPQPCTARSPGYAKSCARQQPPATSSRPNRPAMSSTQTTSTARSSSPCGCARRTSRLSEAADTLTEALALWCGHSYLGVEEDSVRAEATRLDELRHLAAEEHGEALIASGRAAEAIPALESFIAKHPLRERARAGLMRALYAIGRHADALAQYDTYRRLLADELGLEPTEEPARTPVAHPESRSRDSHKPEQRQRRSRHLPTQRAKDARRRHATYGICTTAMCPWGSAASSGPKPATVRPSSRCRPGCPISR